MAMIDTNIALLLKTRSTYLTGITCLVHQLFKLRFGQSVFVFFDREVESLVPAFLAAPLRPFAARRVHILSP
jgi:hypothetical protein